METALAIALIVVAEVGLAVLVGVIARAKGRRFWFWAVVELVLPIIGLVAVVVLPRRSGS
jgi:hypothetical protein